MKNTIGGNIINLFSAKSITLIISMITTMLLARFVTLNEFGSYSQMLLVVNLVSTVFMLGLPSSINYFLARAETNGGETLPFCILYLEHFA